MASRLWASLLGAGLVLTSLSPPAAAQDVVEIVHGLDFPATLIDFRDSCTTLGGPIPPAPAAYLRQGGDRGTHALGWQYDVTGNEVGTLAYVAEPSELTVFKTSVFSPSGQASGHVVAFFDTTAGYTEGYWVGFGGLDHTGSGWKQYNAASTSLTWSYFEGDSSEYNVATGSVQQFATQRGGDGNGAFAGAAFGCDGELFYLDRLVVGHAGDTSTYDYEGLTTRTHLEWSTDGKKVRNGKGFKVQYGQKIWLLGHSHGSPEGGLFTGPGSLWAKTYGQNKFRKVASSEFTPRRYAAFRGAVPRRTVFRFVGEGTDVFEGAGSELVTVQVQAAVRAQIRDRRLVEGQRLSVDGKILPGNRGVKVALQRRKNGKWVTLTRGQTSRRGQFGLGVTAKEPGTWTVRVLVSDGKGNLGNRTSARTVTVARKQAPQPPPPDNNPESEPIATPTAPSVPAAPPDPNYRPGVDLWSTRTAATPSCTMPGPHPFAPCPPQFP